MFTVTNMDSESNGEKESEVNVKYLQASLFPPQVTNSGSYFSTFLFKTTQFVEEDDENKLKLKESLSFRDLFASNKDVSFTLQAPRWPTECQVLEEKIEHINYIPPSLEGYYPVSGNECQPKPSGEECGVVVYQYQPISAVNYFSRSSVGGSSYLLSSNLCPEEDGLKFESRFESANLARAIRITPNYYELHLRADLYTNRHMQWFYFRVTNMKKGFLYRFSITNCSKESSLYNEGMRPLMYSKKDSQLHCIGWRRCGQNISYYCNDNVTPEDPDQQMTYTLTFTVEFPHDDDEVYLAHCYPYTYSDLQDYLQELSSHPVKTNFCSVRLLCKTLAGNNVYFVTITSPAVPGETKKKRAVVITARVHPGETPSSWMAKGVLDFLSGDSSPAKELRDKFIFKIVPMLNPDGVIVGNNRCSLSAKDLNRQYRTVMRDTYPSIWYTKLMVRRLLEECGVAMYCDLHAHSRKHNIFIYGCENRRGNDRRLQEQVFPLMLHKNTAEKFSFESCKFRIQKAKEGTGRVVMWMMGIANSYTMEASFAGSSLGNRTDTHFNTQDFEQMGRSFCQTLLDFYDDDPRKERLRNKIIDRLTKEGSNADEPTNIPLSDYSSDDGDTSSSSDEVGRADDEENEIIVPTPPPPSPVLVPKKTKPKSSPTRRILSRSPCAPRKPLPVNRKYDLELRDYSQEEIDRPEVTDELRERSVCWVTSSEPQHAVVVDASTLVNSSVFSTKKMCAQANSPDSLAVIIVKNSIGNGKDEAVQSSCSATTQYDDGIADVTCPKVYVPNVKIRATKHVKVVVEVTPNNRIKSFKNKLSQSSKTRDEMCLPKFKNVTSQSTTVQPDNNEVDTIVEMETSKTSNKSNLRNKTSQSPIVKSDTTEFVAVLDTIPEFETTSTSTSNFENYSSKSSTTECDTIIDVATNKLILPNIKQHPKKVSFQSSITQCGITVDAGTSKIAISQLKEDATQLTTILDGTTLDVATSKIFIPNLKKDTSQLTTGLDDTMDASTSMPSIKKDAIQLTTIRDCTTIDVATKMSIPILKKDAVQLTEPLDGTTVNVATSTMTIPIFKKLLTAIDGANKMSIPNHKKDPVQLTKPLDGSTVDVATSKIPIPTFKKWSVSAHYNKNTDISVPDISLRNSQKDLSFTTHWDTANVVTPKNPLLYLQKQTTQLTITRHDAIVEVATPEIFNSSFNKENYELSATKNAITVDVGNKPTLKEEFTQCKISPTSESTTQYDIPSNITRSITNKNNKVFKSICSEIKPIPGLPDFNKHHKNQQIFLEKLSKPQQVIGNNFTVSPLLADVNSLNNISDTETQLEHVAILDHNTPLETKSTENIKSFGLDYALNDLSFLESSQDYKKEYISLNQLPKLQYAKVENVKTASKSSQLVDALDLSRQLITETSSVIIDPKSSQTLDTMIDSFKVTSLIDFCNIDHEDCQLSSAEGSSCSLL